MNTARAPRRSARGASAPQRLLELGDGLVQQPHLLVRDAEIVVALVILLLDVLGDALLELPEHVLEVRLLVAGRLLLLDDHARVLGRVVVAEPVAEVHELRVASRRGVGRAGGAAPQPRARARGAGAAASARAPASAKFSSAACTRTSSARGRARVIDGARLVELPARNSASASCEVRLDQRPRSFAEGVLDALLMMADRARVEAHDLVGERRRRSRSSARSKPIIAALELAQPLADRPASSSASASCRRPA